MAERIKSGIPGLDRLIGGGYPKNSVVLVSGGPGTGKTTFAMQYIYNGAKIGEPGVYISFEQEAEHLKDSVKQFGMDFGRLEKQNKAAVLRIKDVQDIADVLKVIEKNVKRIKAKRLVVDSLSSIEIFASTFRSMLKDLPLGVIERRFLVSPPAQAIIRRLIYRIIDYFKELNLTTLLISESEDTQYSRHGVAEFVVDGIVKMEAEVMGKNLQRNLVVIKMRETDMDGGRHSVEIGKRGLRIVD